MKAMYVLVLATAGVFAGLFTQHIQAADPDPNGAPRCQEAITVFQDVSPIGRKNGAARNMTQRHQEMARERWRFVDMEPYTENGDLEGFYLSYTRDISCTGIERD